MLRICNNGNEKQNIGTIYIDGNDEQLLAKQRPVMKSENTQIDQSRKTLTACLSMGERWTEKVRRGGVCVRCEQTSVSTRFGLGENQSTRHSLCHHGKQEVKTHSNQQAQKQKSAYL